MTYRERMENRLSRREEWAEKAKQRSDASFNTVRSIADNIPLGQPILVGHHSEKRHRRDAERIDNGMRKAVEEQQLSEHHFDKAEGIAFQLDRSIFDDDENAIEALEARIAEREAESERMKEINKAYKKGGSEGLREYGLSEATINSLLHLFEVCPYEKSPFPSYKLTNLRASIRRDKERVEMIKRRQARTERAEAAGGVVIEGGEWVRVTFAEKPEREILNSLKEAGFHWSKGSWVGRRDELPEGIER